MPKQMSARSPSLTSQESYSAVIIADMIAEVPVHVEAVPIVKTGSSIKTKDETNLGYDNQMDTDATTAAVVKVDAMETVNMRSQNGASISKGVILNALQFGQNVKLKPYSPKDDKPIQMNNVQVPDTHEATNKDQTLSSEFKEMSPLRKVAFGFSFLPSIMFVLCFAIILPCEEVPPPSACVQEKWSTILNDTVVTSRLKVPQNILFSFSRKNLYGVMGIDENSGSLSWQSRTANPFLYLECGNLNSVDRVDCVVMDDSGILYLYNASDGAVLWTRDIREKDYPSLPVILSDCNSDGISEIAFATAKNIIKVLYGGNIVSSVHISGCDSVPSGLTVWPRENKTDLIYICKKGEKEMLVTLPQNKWCVYDNRPKPESKILETRSQGDFAESKLLPTNDFLVLWTGNNVTMFNPDGEEQWTVSSAPHIQKNRFLLHGKFNNKNSQIALFSSDILSKLQITTLNVSNGNVTWTNVSANVELSDVALIHGKEKDLVLGLLKKMKVDFTTEAATYINGVSTTIMSFLANEDINSTSLNLTNSAITEEISLFELDKGDNHHILEENESPFKDELRKSTVTVIQDDKDEESDLRAYILEVLRYEETSTSSQLRRIDIAKWDISSVKASQCTWK